MSFFNFLLNYRDEVKPLSTNEVKPLSEDELTYTTRRYLSFGTYFF